MMDPTATAKTLPAHAPAIRTLGRVDFEPTWRSMQSFTAARDAQTRDELWIVEHPPVYTVGLAGRAERFPRSDDKGAVAIPVVHTDRGGQITYHGPGQVIVYALVNLARRGIKVREMVCLLEQAAIDVLATHGIAAERKSGAPGVYLADGSQRGAKIAALGLKVKRQGCYHGISLNVDMADAELAPFAAIDPCGYPGLAVTSMRKLGAQTGMDAVGQALARRIAQAVVHVVQMAPTPCATASAVPA